MIANLTMLIAESSLALALPGSRAMGIALWIGLAILSIALVVLMRTHWGQAQPLSKCIVLSVFAHLLLFMYAYGTRLFVERPPGKNDQPIQLAFVTADDASHETKSKPEQSPWNELTSDDTVSPDSVEAARSEVVDENISRTAESEDWQQSDDVMPSDQLADTIPDSPTDVPAAPLPSRPNRSPVAAAVMDPVPRRKVAEQTPVLPDQETPDRIRITPSSSRMVDAGAEDSLPSQLMDIGSRMQQLADIAPRAETGDSLPGAIDQVEQSENRGTSAIESTGIVRQRAATESADQQPLVAIPTVAPAAMRRPDSAAQPKPMTIEQIVANVPRRIGDGQPVPAPYRLRTSSARDEVAVTLGGGARAAAAVESGLAWLAAQQETDGRWDPDRWGAGIETRVDGEDREGAGANADTGITGLAILAFLANGQNHLEGMYRKNVQHGLEFLLRSQTEDGCLAGGARMYAKMYCHGMASLALSEAFALTGDVRIKPYLQHAVDYTTTAQHATTGGWRYRPGDKGDMSQFGWQVMALRSAELAGISISQRTRDGMLHFLGLCQQGAHGGLAGYRPGLPPSRTMTAESLACRYFIEPTPGPAQVSEATSYLLGELPQSGTANYYYWYYGTMALFQTQSEAWEHWNEAMQRELVHRQRTDGHLAGSWDPESVWGSYGGRIYSTSMATLCLEVYYRYLPLTAIR